MTKTKIPTSYKELLIEVMPSCIKNNREYNRQLTWIDRILRAEGPVPKNSARIKMMALLVLTVHTWEAKVSPDPNVSPIDMLKHVMDERDISQASLANSIGLSRQFVSALLKGGRDISRDTAIKLSKSLNLPVEIFIGSTTGK